MKSNHLTALHIAVFELDLPSEILKNPGYLMEILVSAASAEELSQQQFKEVGMTILPSNRPSQQIWPHDPWDKFREALRPAPVSEQEDERFTFEDSVGQAPEPTVEAEQTTLQVTPESISSTLSDVAKTTDAHPTQQLKPSVD